MQLPLSQASFSGSLLLLLMSNMFLWENVASVPKCYSHDGQCEVSTEEMFDRAIKQAETFRSLAADLYEELFRNPYSSKTFLDFLARIIREERAIILAKQVCFTASIELPDVREERNTIRTKRYLKLLIKFVDSWTNPLSLLVTELERMKVPDAILSKAKNIQETSKELVADLKWILTKVHPDAQMKEKYPVWTHIPFLRGNNEELRNLAIFNAASCLRGDSGQTLNHLKSLKCRVTTTNKLC